MNFFDGSILNTPDDGLDLINAIISADCDLIRDFILHYHQVPKIFNTVPKSRNFFSI